jgi:hypothetical protein
MKNGMENLVGKSPHIPIIPGASTFYLRTCNDADKVIHPKYYKHLKKSAHQSWFLAD